MVGHKDEKTGKEDPIRFFYPTKLGMELYVWAHGDGEEGAEAYIDEKLKFRIVEDLAISVKIRQGIVTFV